MDLEVYYRRLNMPGESYVQMQYHNYMPILAEYCENKEMINKPPIVPSWTGAQITVKHQLSLHQGHGS
jgi:hypothetical protein